MVQSSAAWERFLDRGGGGGVPENIK